MHNTFCIKISSSIWAIVGEVQKMLQFFDWLKVRRLACQVLARSAEMPVLLKKMSRYSSQWLVNANSNKSESTVVQCLTNPLYHTELVLIPMSIA